ncbi:SET domain-containing protein 9 [Gadus chalcogrammus]|uniref:SET domain-containing protein 9 n=1 Tax=Gadus chalcogrammus TaxID=1042646 RepID=UPI0024C31E87|nr:SET domain-containing protein 9 [Gadus chalcogrammus]
MCYYLLCPIESNVMIRAALTTFQNKWRNYRHRFVPWIALNLRRNEGSLRHVTKSIQDKPIHDEVVSETLLKLFGALLERDGADGKQSLKETRLRPKVVQTKSNDAREMHEEGRMAESDDLIFQSMGFCIHRRPSSVPLAGVGVFITKGWVPKGTVVAMYPGTVYEAYEPIFFQSLRNPFVFRCIDGVLVDGNDKGISKLVYKSCSRRDMLGPYRLSDFSWLTNPKNPLAIGQYVNNCNDSPANVCYQEYDVPRVFPLELHQYLPNVKYSHETQRPIRCIVLVSLRDISPGEELFSNYYTIVES